MAACSTRKGDIVCVLFGCDMPVILRKKAGNRHVFVGVYYAKGVMQGEAMSDLADGKYAATEFQIHRRCAKSVAVQPKYRQEGKQTFLGLST
jgi:hypothetical protein